MPESCIVILDPSEYMRNGDYISTRYEAQQDAARWLIADITTSSPENTVGVMKGTSVLVSTTNNIGQLFEAVKSNPRRYTGDFEIENSLQVAFMALKHRRNKVGSQRIILFVGSPILDHTSFPKLSKNLRKNNVSLQIITLGDEPNQDKLELLIQNINSEDSRMINVPKGTVPSEFLSATSTFGTANGFTHETSGGDMMDTFDPSMDPELAMALQISLQEERTRQEQLQQHEEDEQREEPAVEDSAETIDVASSPLQSQVEAVDGYDDEMAMMQHGLALSLQEAADGQSQTEQQAKPSVPSPSSSLEDDKEASPSTPELEEVIEMQSTDEDSKVEPELVTIQARAASSTFNDSDDSSSRPGSSPENAISLVDVEDDSMRESLHRKQCPSAAAASAAATAATMSSSSSNNSRSLPPPQPAMIINVEDEKYAANTDVWEDEPKRSFGEEDSNTDEVFENEPRTNVVASSIDHYEAEAMLLVSPPKSGDDETPKNYDDEAKMILMMPATTTFFPSPRDEKQLPPQPSMPPPDVPQTTSSQESNWNQINQALDVYYTASSEVNGMNLAQQHQLQQQQQPNEPIGTHLRSLSNQTSGSSPNISSCWSNLDEAFDEYNIAIHEISNFLPATGNAVTMMPLPPAQPPIQQQQGEEERQDNVPREEYQKLASELDETKKAMAIMQGIVQEKDEMIVALREIMGMMQQERRNQENEAPDENKNIGKGRSETESERKMTDSLIQEIRKKNENLESLRLSLANYKNKSGETSATAPISQSLSEKRRKKRELEKLRANQKRPTTQN
ncbi:MAG: hypothetical protein SGBAC_007873 [Bacillariaceae sp.]